ncbi:hypothetical protein MTR72_13685 [Bradyrhizobium sp. ISRA442]|uniref:hypothetical protein n=1 Tax=Bradyrhizobium sp. ISRA442 TaxID=2866197 RepID=UPI00311AD4CE
MGVSGRTYQFEVHAIGASYFEKPGVYIFVKRASNGGWDAIYIGETSSFKRRLTDELRLHHQWTSILAQGATHIATMHVPGQLVVRETIETDLRRAISTPCNLQ